MELFVVEDSFSCTAIGADFLQWKKWISVQWYTKWKSKVESGDIKPDSEGIKRLGKKTEGDRTLCVARVKHLFYIFLFEMCITTMLYNTKGHFDK